jgi:drug/metabolite transporter (DMT)-like permease
VRVNFLVIKVVHANATADKAAVVTPKLIPNSHGRVMIKIPANPITAARTRMRILAAVMGFAGILIITRPWEFGISFGVTTAALSAVAFAWTTLMTKKLTRTETVTCVLFYLTVMQAVFGVICAGYDGDIAVPSMTALPYVMVIALCGLLAHFCITSALALAPATVVIPVDFARLPMIAVIGMLAYGEALDVMVLAGAVLIFVGNYSNILHETRGQS